MIFNVSLFVHNMFSSKYSVYDFLSCSVILIVICLSISEAGQLLTKEHRTQAAAERVRDLWCYHCDTMDAGDRCVNLEGNRSDQHIKCNHEKRSCMVKRISITMSTENTTSTPRLWLLQRTCSKHCEPGCILIGERTKLHACTTCCDGDFCNVGNGSAPPPPPPPGLRLAAGLVAVATVLRAGLA